MFAGALFLFFATFTSTIALGKHINDVTHGVTWRDQLKSLIKKESTEFDEIYISIVHSRYFLCNWSLCLPFSSLVGHPEQILVAQTCRLKPKTSLSFLRTPSSKQGDWHQRILDHEQLFRDVALSDWHTATPGAATYRAYNFAVGETS